MEKDLNLLEMEDNLFFWEIEEHLSFWELEVNNFFPFTASLASPHWTCARHSSTPACLSFFLISFSVFIFNGTLRHTS